MINGTVAAMSIQSGRVTRHVPRSGQSGISVTSGSQDNDEITSPDGSEVATMASALATAMFQAVMLRRLVVNAMTAGTHRSR